jgi:hypothetical protein
VIDDTTLEEGELTSSTTADEVQLVAEVSRPWSHQVAAAPLVPANIQEVTRRYQEEWPVAGQPYRKEPLPDFIPLSPRRGRGSVNQRLPLSPRRARAAAGQGAGQRRARQLVARARRGGPVPHLAPAHLLHAPRFSLDHVAGLNLNFGGFSGARGGGFRFEAGRGRGDQRRGGDERRGGGQRRGGGERQLVAQGPTMFGGEAATGSTGLRPIVIDGSNVAMAHGNNMIFSSKGESGEMWSLQLVQFQGSRWLWTILRASAIRRSWRSCRSSGTRAVR